jgi:hypothetical protein
VEDFSVRLSGQSEESDLDCSPEHIRNTQDSSITFIGRDIDVGPGLRLYWNLGRERDSAPTPDFERVQTVAGWRIGEGGLGSIVLGEMVMNQNRAQTGPSDSATPRGITRGVPTVVRTSSFPQYAYGILQAASLAQRLNLSSITVAELGVAGGNGLVELERLSGLIGLEREVDIKTVGFDLGSGMPEPVDYRDMPYVWQRGFFKMDEDLIRSRLVSTRVILGDIAETGSAFIATAPAPIGFLSFDLDYYSSTVSAMQSLLNDKPEGYLPRVFCYFDDTIGPHEELHSEFAGELLAIREFNTAHERRKLAKVHGLRYKLLPLEEPWIDAMYVLHIFDHPRYNEYVYHERDRQFPLEMPKGVENRRKN